VQGEYSNYQDWKGWKDFGVLTPSRARYFARELAVLGPLRNKRILEIGFGNGSFLRFAQAQGSEVTGTEVIPELLRAARDAGFQVSESPALFGDRSQAGSFDAVVAFDVIEHIGIDALPGFFAAVNGVLKPGGTFVARFPNGDSPFGRRYQHGDLTHKTVIGAGMVTHLAATSGFTVAVVRNPRTEYLGNPLVQLAQLLQRGLRSLVEMGLGYLFFSRRVPMDQNLLAQLVKRLPKPVTAAGAALGAGRGSRPRRGPRRATHA
jgi:2-polyprenyl-3-methyl-5-hydroxy-6-metoxy-1,4-benzoquinol methylase